MKPPSALASRPSRNCVEAKLTPGPLTVKSSSTSVIVSPDARPCIACIRVRMASGVGGGFGPGGVPGGGTKRASAGITCAPRSRETPIMPNVALI